MLKSFTINKEIQIKATVEQVFTALTTSSEIIEYYPLTSVESDWILNGEVIYKGEANGIPFTDFGIIREMSYPTSYVYSYWSDNHGTEQKPENYITIGYSLKALENTILVKMEQRNIPSIELYELMNNQVWDFLLNSLKNYIEANQYE